MKTKNGFYDIFVKSTAKYPSKVAVRLYDDARGTYVCYTYSEMFGVSEYIAQQLRQLNCNRGIIGLISKINIVVPCVVAAAHKCSTSFIFLDPNNTMEKALEELDFTCLIGIMKDNDNLAFEKSFKKPDIVIKVFGMKISFYDNTPPQPVLFKKAHIFSNTHSFIAMTSGSSGKPKRVEVPVHCIMPNIKDLTTLFNITTDDVIFFSTPLTFDPSMVEILLAWMNGASLLIAPGTIEVIFPKNNHAVTVWQTTPSKFFLYSNAHIKSKILGANSPLKILALGGEPLHGVQRLRELKHLNNKTKLFTLYGVTEMSCWACVAELDLNKIQHDHEVPLGNALSETKIVVESDPKDDTKDLGRIILASKTRQCYIVNKMTAGQNRTSLKFVDTGDLGEVSNGGIIYYRGRRDDVIKRFGSKINLRFIESTCMICPRVKACACIWLPKPKLLVVYFCSDTLNSQDLSDFLKCKLDDKHWPDKIIRIDRMPVSTHGKISKSILSQLQDKVGNMPLTCHSLRSKFLQELKTILSLRVTYDDIKNRKFLAIGGSSFLAVTLCNTIAHNYPEFGQFLLPHLLSSKNTIDEIMTMAEKEVCLNANPKKRPKKTESEVHTETSSVVIKRNKMQNVHSPSNPVEFVEMWTWNSGKCVDATPSLLQTGVNLYVTVGSHSGIVVVVDGLTGIVVGELRLKSRVEAAVCCYSGWATIPPCGVVGTYDGTVLCYTIESCEELWRTHIRSMIKSKAVCCKGFAYIASYDGNIRKLDILTGKQSSITSVSEQAISADLVLAKGEYIMVGSLSGMCGGYHIASNLLAWRCSLESPIFAAPVVYAQDKYVIFAHVNGEIHCMTVEKGIKIWKYSSTGGNIFSSILVREPSPQKFQLVFGCYDKNLYSIILNNFQPSLNWKTALTAPIYATPCKLSNKKFFMAASNDGKIHIICAEFGVILAQYSLPDESFSSPVCYGDYIFIGCRNNLIYSLRCILNV